MNAISSKLAIAVILTGCISGGAWAGSRSAMNQLSGGHKFSAKLPVPKAVRVKTKRKRSGGGNCAAYAGIVQREAQSQGVSASLVMSVIRAESTCNPRAVSPKGARGLMQLMPGTARGLGVRDLNSLFNPAVNIHYGVKYLKQQTSRYGNKMGLAAYNAGPKNIHTRYRNKETLGYLGKFGYGRRK